MTDRLAAEIAPYPPTAVVHHSDVDGSLLEAWLASLRDRQEAEAVRASIRSDPDAAARLADAVAKFPEPGQNFLGFGLMHELGRGGFGRVYLARQGELAGRLVVLKVSAHFDGESQALAQLQHTNIVPIYSEHHHGSLRAVCMPYLGATTLADLLRDLRSRETMPDSGKHFVTLLLTRKTKSGSAAPEPARSAPPEPLPAEHPPAADLDRLRELSYVEAVLLLAAKLADGLAHAHERGILHRDLKPANILLTDDGQPLLLDFNLAEDTKKQRSAARAKIGGTLPYMSPEQLEAAEGGVEPVDARSDIYSLGLILFELLTGRRAYQVLPGTNQWDLAGMIRDRAVPPPSPRRWNPGVSPATASIVLRCLQPLPGRRYQSARELHEDLERQLHHEPLRFARDPSPGERLGKWSRRHPRLASGTTVAVLAGLLLAGLASAFALDRASRAEREARRQAQSAWQAFQDERDEARFLLTRLSDPERPGEAVEAGRRALAVFGAADDTDWQDRPEVRFLPPAARMRLVEEVGDLLALLAAAHRHSGEAREAERLEELARACPPADDTARTIQDHYQAASGLAAQGRFREALAEARQVTARDPQHFWGWFLQGRCHDSLGQDGDSIACYATCIALKPKMPWAYNNRALASARQSDWRQAKADLDRAIRLKSDHPNLFVDRAIIRNNLKDAPGAIEDLDKALELGATQSRIFLLRARFRESIKDLEGARRDREEGMKRTPSDEKSWVSRGIARLSADPKAALADFEEALKLNRRSLYALKGKAKVLSEDLGKPQEAVRAMDQAVVLYPDNLQTRADRGVLLARLGKTKEAAADARECLKGGAADPRALYQTACIFALSSRTDPAQRKEALKVLARALQPRGYGAVQLGADHDLDSLRQEPAFIRLLDAIRFLAATSELK